MKTLGRHILVEYYDCDSGILNDLKKIREAMIGAAKAAKARIVEVVFHEFNPHGISGVVVIAESHLAIHTWPEFGYAAVDLFTCGQEGDPWESYDYLAKALKSGRCTSMEMRRGMISEEVNCVVKPSVKISPAVKQSIKTSSHIKIPVKIPAVAGASCLR